MAAVVTTSQGTLGRQQPRPMLPGAGPHTPFAPREPWVAQAHIVAICLVLPI